MSTEEISVNDFMKLDIRVGTVLMAKRKPKARSPSYELVIDFGNIIGEKRSSAQIVENHSESELIGMQICAVVNLPSLRVAGVKSEVLVLAIVCSEKGTVLIQPSMPVNNGVKLA